VDALAFASVPHSPTEIEPSTDSEVDAMAELVNAGNAGCMDARTAFQLPMEDAEEAAVGIEALLQRHEGAMHAPARGGEVMHVFAVDGRSEQRLVQLPAGSDAAGDDQGGAPAQACEGSLCVAQHPDVLPFNAAIWACVGDPTNAFAALGG
jgi:hypothetical protein